MYVSREEMRRSPVVDLFLAAGQVTCVAALLYSGKADPGPQELTHGNVHTHT